MKNLSGEKGKILVVDDEASIRRILQTRLEMIGCAFVFRVCSKSGIRY
ncbi:hypothetical protein [Nostoc sp. LEGE 12447]|nr:hypothetical protein [Nostoc sp. LEGE 12447]